MTSHFRKWISLMLIVVSTIAFSIPGDLLAAEDHIVNSAELQRALLASVEARQDRINQIKEFFASELGSRVLRSAGVTSAKVERALPLLSDQELSELASKTQTVKSNFAAGYHEHEVITILIILLLVVAVVVIVQQVD